MIYNESLIFLPYIFYIYSIFLSISHCIIIIYNIYFIFRYNVFDIWLQKLDNIVKAIDPNEVIKTRQIPKNAWEKLTEHGVFKARVPEDYKGFNFLNSEFSRIIEVTSQIPGLGQLILKQGLSPIDLLVKYGTVEQKLSNFSKKVSLALYEADNCNKVPQHFQTLATEFDNDNIILNGVKTFVANADCSDVFLVFGHSEIRGPETLSTFLVEKNLEGVNIQESTNFLGLPGFCACTIQFQDVKISQKNILGKVGDGSQHLATAFENTNHYLGAQVVGIMKNMLDLLTQNVLNRKQFNKFMHEFTSVRQIISRISNSIYGIESALYMTLGMQDLYKDQDVQVESTLVEIFAVEECMKRIPEAMNIFGPLGILEEEPYKQFLLDAFTLVHYESKISEKKKAVGLTLLQNYEKDLGHKIHDIWGKFRRRVHWPEEILQLHLEEHLHPSFHECSERMETGVFTLMEACRLTLVNHGEESRERLFELYRICDIMVQIFVFAANCSRASRSYCIGHKNSEDEYKMCEGTSYNFMQNIENLGNDMKKDYGNKQRDYSALLDSGLKSKMLNR